MAFENAIITKEDDEKYGLSKIYYKYNPKREVFINKQDWVINRELDCWLWDIFYFPDPEYDHGTLVKAIWILYYKGEIIEVVLDYDINRALIPKQFHRIWQLLDLNPKQTKLISRDEIIILLDNALQTYGYDGIWEQIPNYTMEVQDLTDHAAK